MYNGHKRLLICNYSWMKSVLLYMATLGIQLQLCMHVAIHINYNYQNNVKLIIVHCARLLCWVYSYVVILLSSRPFTYSS